MTRHCYKVAFFCLLVLPGTAMSGQSSEQITLQILVQRHPLGKGTKEFQFDVLAQEKTIDGRPLTVEPSSIQGLEIWPDPKTKSTKVSNGAVVYHYDARLPKSDLNLAELRADLFIRSKDGTPTAMKQA